jgi:hypothetical protein
MASKLSRGAVRPNNTLGAPTRAEVLRRMADAAEQGEKDTREGGSTPQPADFFQPGHTYLSRHDGYTAPELIAEFLVEHVTTHPEHGFRRAIGWMRSCEPDAKWHGNFQDEHEYEGWTGAADGGTAPVEGDDFTGSELYEMDRSDEYAADAADEARDIERGDR